MIQPSKVLLLVALAAGCSGSDDGEPAVWSAVFADQPGAILRVWGYSSKDVYVVGAASGGSGPIARHFDGEKWRDLSPPGTGSLWWVQGVGPDDVRMVGDAGTVLKYTPSTDAFEVLETPTDQRLFGVWGDSPDDVWYAGGTPGANPNRGVVLRDDGSTIREVTLTSTGSAAFFKVIAFGSEAVWLVGTHGTAVFFDGTEYRETDTQTPFSLMGVHGTSADHLWAVGGGASGQMLFWNGSTWQAETPPGTPQMIGVWAVDAETVYACGFNGAIYRRAAGGTWARLPETVPTFQDLHAIWVDDKGAIWAVGGRLVADPPSGGALVRYGPPISTEVE